MLVSFRCLYDKRNDNIFDFNPAKTHHVFKFFILCQSFFGFPAIIMCKVNAMQYNLRKLGY